MKVRIESLRDQVEIHNKSYYTGNPTIPDIAFDKMFNKLVELEKQYPEFYCSNSPTQRVGSEILNKFGRVKHVAMALSIKNATVEQIQYSLNRYGELVAETKYDGVCISLIYKKGKLTQAITRGDGITGNNVTANARTIKNIPLTIPYKQTIEIRGEVVLPKYQLNTNKYPNCQAAAAAIMRFKKSKETACHALQYIAHGIGGSIQTVLIERDWLNKFGFKTPQTSIVDNPGHVLLAKDLIFDGNLPTDGVVFKVNDATKRKSLGNNKRYFNWAWAWKPANQHSTKVIGVNWNVSAHGNITPVACFQKAMTVNGNKVAKAALHNFNNILGLQIGEGATASITFTGTVPAITETSGAKHIEPKPTQCPSCRGPVVNVGRYIRCENPNTCSAQGGIPEKETNFKYTHTQCHFLNWTTDHAAIVARKLNMNVQRTKKGSPYITLKFNALSQLSKFAYCMAAEQVPTTSN